MVVSGSVLSTKLKKSTRMAGIVWSDGYEMNSSFEFAADRRPKQALAGVG